MGAYIKGRTIYDRMLMLMLMQMFIEGFQNVRGFADAYAPMAKHRSKAGVG